MKNTTAKAIAAITLCACIGLAAIGCSTSQDEQDTTSAKIPSKTETHTSSTYVTESANEHESVTVQTNNDISEDAYKEKVKYYSELVSALQAELLEVKEQSYIKESEYTQKIQDLENTVQTLINKMEDILTGNQDKIPSPSYKDDADNSSPDGIVAKSDFEYSVNNGTITIMGYLGTEYDVVIPSTVDGLPVVAIGEDAFRGARVTSISIPSSVKTIDWFAFAQCTSLKEITIPFSVTSISYGAFDYCPKDMKIICPKGSYAEAYALSWGLYVISE